MKSRAEDRLEGDGAFDAGGQRIDLWLWHARFFKTRPIAAAAAAKGRMRLNRQAVRKSHQTMNEGDVITLAQGDRVRVVRVLGFARRRGSATQAALLYEDVTPDDEAAPAPSDAWASR